MSRPNKPRTIGAEDRVMVRIKAMREARGWSNATLAQKMAEVGCPTDSASLWRNESAVPRRRLPVDEFVAYARAFGVSPEQLLSEEPLRVTQEFE